MFFYMCKFLLKSLLFGCNFNLIKEWFLWIECYFLLYIKVVKDVEEYVLRKYMFLIVLLI